ncbi:hypothetical protein L226DRAFT_535107 [Lentinus tigrinus ALCF2SS1-7]|uniref:Uncharacterized protein n=1 Tax=Lentinus tigrinus ALCF2SS1-6 TaxID=1328759 RepID=A0A5C2SA79_9APHY|nr:hypothetical protein L227DRAFT_625162 [Lentinus tigrinus ALCF2SS1-6]RPD74893.1 hypothetical protein L226DRAFT_535107 [Lentinus tigrinus ALCF2SS1-7]
MRAEFVVRHHPAQGLRRLVIADSPAALDLWSQSFKELVEAFPKDVKNALRRNVDEDRQIYYAAMLKVYALPGASVPHV